MAVAEELLRHLIPAQRNRPNSSTGDRDTRDRRRPFLCRRQHLAGIASQRRVPCQEPRHAGHNICDWELRAACVLIIADGGCH